MRIRVEAQGLERAQLWLEAMSRNAKTLYPLANRARERWHRSEERAFKAGKAEWPARKPATIRRYKFPIRTLNGMRKGRSQNRGPGHFTGGLRRSLTRPQQPGIRDTVRVGRGRLALDVGIKGGRQPRAYGRWLDYDVVVFDRIARRGLANDTRQHLMGRRPRTLR